MNDVWEIALAVAVLLPLLAFVDWKLIKEERGAEIVEFAVILPLLCMVLFGMFWFARSFNIYETLTRVAREGAAFGARPNCALCGGGVMGGFPTADSVAAVMLPQLAADHIGVADLAVIAKPPQFTACRTGNGFSPSSPCPVGNNKQAAPCDSSQGGKVWVCRCVDMKPDDNSGTSYECGVAVAVAYPWRFPLPFSSLSNQLFTITAQTAQRQEF